VVPTDIALDDISHVGVLDPVEGLVGPLLIADLGLITSGECAVLDEESADVVARM
jgi:hypothetical protein